jgi:nucleotide-binding universal stress UspA family protein
MMKRLDLRHILCPIDFSPRSAPALATASAVARARQAELRALHVVPAKGPVAPRGVDGVQHQAVMSQLRESLAEVGPAPIRIGAAVRHGDPATHILRFARTLPADLIVMGAPGVNRPERPMGPVTAVVVARSECPVLTVPARRTKDRSKATGLFRRIVCAIDLAPSSASVIHQALSLAWETGARLTYVCAVPRNSAKSSAEIRSRLLTAIPSEASRWSQVNVIVQKGVAGNVIVRVARELDADLVVVGAPRRWTSTTHAVLSRSLCPVLVTHDAKPLPRPIVEERHQRVGTAAFRR